MMVGRPVQLEVVKAPAQPKETVLHVEGLTIASRGHHKRNAVDGVSLMYVPVRSCASPASTATARRS